MIPAGRGGLLRALLVLTSALAIDVPSVWCQSGASDAGVVTGERRVTVMGTSLDVAVSARDRASALAASELAIAEVRRVEDLLTTWRDDSPLAQLNASPAGQAGARNAELVSVLLDVFAWSAKTRRAFDPTVLPLVRAWDLRGAGRIPSREALTAALAATGLDRFRLDPALGTATRLDPSAGIDDGAWGKGYALDRAAHRLASAGAKDALLDLGGQVLARGANADGKPWTIAIADPRDRGRPVVVLALQDLSAATSGNSERRRVVSGRPIGHLLDPRTGAPASDFGSVTVVSPSALVADVLSTALFVLGPEEGLALSAQLRRDGTPNEVLFLVERGDGLAAVVSPGLSPLVLSAGRKVSGLATKHPN